MNMIDAIHVINQAQERTGIRFHDTATCAPLWLTDNLALESRLDPASQHALTLYDEQGNRYFFMTECHFDECIEMVLNFGS